MEAVRIRVTGLVQGVFFRAEAKEQADKLGLMGFARNEEDGSVMILAQGEHDELEKFTEWCSHGPDRAKVEDLQIVASEPEQLFEFEIRI